jgi:hypothetical protein
VLGFCFNSVGIWAILDVDESLPFYKDFPDNYKVSKNKKYKTEQLMKILETKFLGAHSSKNNLWVSYLEKAYAKLNEGYFNICNNGHAKHAFTDITSAPSRTFQLSTPNMGLENLRNLVSNY